jgi:hypothetical protein
VSEFKDWLSAFARIVGDLPERRSEICPSCSDGIIQYQYVGDVQTRIGYASVWCDSCSRGIVISRVSAPNGVSMLSFEDVTKSHSIPDFTQVSP